MPINLDIAALARALVNRGTGELGSHFTGRAFNGIVYVTQTWKTSSSSARAPLQSVSTTTTAGEPGVVCRTAPAPTSPLASENGEPPRLIGPDDPLAVAVPMTIVDCTSSTPTLSQPDPPVSLCSGDGVGPNLSGLTAGHFKTRRCDDNARFGSDGGDGARPNALRIYRAGTITPAVFPAGLTIATNLPLYVYGDVNNDPDTVSRRKVLFAADRVTLLSNEFRDDVRPWNSAPSAPAGGSAVVLASIITGVPNGVDVEGAFHALESFDSQRIFVRGSLVIGFRSILSSDPRGVGRGLIWERDEHLDDPLVQPPGVPRVLAGVTGRWRR